MWDGSGEAGSKLRYAPGAAGSEDYAAPGKTQPQPLVSGEYLVVFRRLNPCSRSGPQH